MSIYKINVDDPWYSLLSDGTKMMVGVINNGNITKVKKNDSINISKNDKDDGFDLIIKDVDEYNSFRDLITEVGLDNVFPTNIETIEDGIKIFRERYSEGDDGDEVEYGVLAILFEDRNPINADKPTPPDLMYPEESGHYKQKYMKYKKKYLALKKFEKLE